MAFPKIGEDFLTHTHTQDMAVCVSLDKDNHRIFEWRSGSDVAWAETIETLQLNFKGRGWLPFSGGWRSRRIPAVR